MTYRKIYSNFSSSCKNNEELRSFCEFAQNDYFQILHPILIRWLSNQLAVERPLKMWHPLKMHYLANSEEHMHPIISKLVSSQEDEVNEDSLSVAEWFLYFVNSTLPIVNFYTAKPLKNWNVKICFQAKCIRSYQK
jgi:hypothetical protein